MAFLMFASVRIWNMTQKTLPLFLAAATIFSAWLICTPIGFSLSTCRPARKASMAIGGWK